MSKAQAKATRQRRVADQLIGQRHATTRGREGESCATGLMSVRPIGSSLEGAKATHGGENSGSVHERVGVVIAVLPSRRTLLAVVATVFYNRMALQGLGAKRVSTFTLFFYVNVLLSSFLFFMLIFMPRCLYMSRVPPKLLKFNIEEDVHNIQKYYNILSRHLFYLKGIETTSKSKCFSNI